MEYIKSLWAMWSKEWKKPQIPTVIIHTQRHRHTLRCRRRFRINSYTISSFEVTSTKGDDDSVYRKILVIHE